MTWTTPSGQVYNLYCSMLKENHLLIAGATGSGTSVVLNALIYTALFKSPNKVGFILCDPKRVELRRYKDLPHVLRFANSLETIASALEYASEIMENRFKRMERKGQLETDEKDIYVIVDEVAYLVTRGADRQENALKKSCEARIESIARLGRAAHVHLILATQAPNRQTLKANITLNMTARVALYCESPIESRQIIGCNGAETLPRYGQCYYKTPEGLERWNLPMIPDEKIAEQIKWWTNQNGFLSRLFRTAW